MEKKSRPIIALAISGLGLFQFTRMPYGMPFAGALLQCLLDKVIGPEIDPCAFSYCDDMIIATKTFEDHVKCLKHILG